MRGLRNALALLVMAPVAAIVAGFAGNIHPIFDSLAAFRLHFALAVLALFPLFWLFRARLARWLAILGLTVAVLGMLPALIPTVAPARVDLRGYSQNLLFRNAALDQVETAIRDSKADFVLLQEVSRANYALLNALKDRYPTQIVCDFRGVGGVAVLTNLPVFGQEHCGEVTGLAWVEVQVPDGLVTLGSVHLGWPWPYEQAAHVRSLTPALRAMPGRVILAGDFNMAPWGASVRQVARLTRTEVVQGLRLTFDKKPLWPGLPLDHVLVNEALEAHVLMLGKYGSDHSALLTEIRFR
ncbi:endonuclease/exonuclease/phosphatase family protein [Halovulum sp. GXIMD14793]